LLAQSRVISKDWLTQHTLFYTFFVCSPFSCAGAETVVGLNRGRIDEPASCAECHNKGSMELILNRSVYLNKQVIRMQVRNQAGGMGYPRSGVCPTFLRPIGAALLK
jgi:DNA replicative helicase MCM subunit Mcm2 (Cdc46/Mcm family)